MKDLSLEELVKIREDLEKIHNKDKELKSKGIPTKNNSYDLANMTPQQINDNWTNIKKDCSYEKLREDSKLLQQKNKDIKDKAQTVFKNKIDSGSIDVRNLTVQQIDAIYKDIEKSII